MSEFSGVVKAGVIPGAPDYDFEIKMLICYLLAGVRKPLNSEQLKEILVAGGLVNYFELIQAVEELVRLGHLVPDGDNPGMYSISEAGKKASALCERDIPAAARERALSRAQELLARLRCERDTRVEIRPAEDGFLLDLEIVDIGSNLLDLTLFVPTHEQAELLREKFLYDPIFLYRGVLALLSGDSDAIRTLEPSDRSVYLD